MKITKKTLKQIIQEEIKSILSEQKEQGYRYVVNKFSLGGQHRVDIRVVEVKTSKIIASEGAMGTSEKEAFDKVRVKLAEKLSKLGLDLTKIPAAEQK